MTNLNKYNKLKSKITYHYKMKNEKQRRKELTTAVN